jgi:hypothetical protein
MKIAARLTLLLPLVLLASASLAPAAEKPQVTAEVTVVEGTWDAVASTPEGDIPATITIKKTESGPRAEVDIFGLKRTVTNEKLEGNVFRMTVEYEGNLYAAEGKVEGDALDGTWQGASYSGTLKAKRRP